MAFSVEVDGQDLALENCAVSISWFVVTDPLAFSVVIDTTRPDVVGWICWVNNSRAAGQKSFDIALFIEVSPAYAV